MSVHLNVYSSVCLFIQPFTCPSYCLLAHLSNYPTLSINQSMKPVIGLSPSISSFIRLSVHISVHPTVCLSIYLSTQPFICPPFYLSHLSLKICVPIQLFVCQFICPFNHSLVHLSFLLSLPSHASTCPQFVTSACHLYIHLLLFIIF